MKREFTKLMAAFTLLALLIPFTGWGQTRTETVVYTLDGTITGGSNGYATESDITQGGISWKVMANTMENPWRFGGKSITDEDRPAYTTTALTNNNTNITKVVVTTGTANVTSVNSVKLIVANNANFTSATTLTESWVASSTITFNRPTGADWTDKYFKIVYNVTVSGSSNKYAQFVKAEFYAETGGSQPQTYTVTYDANGGTGTMTDSDSPYNAGATVTVLGNEFTRTGYEFDHWNTAADDSGTSYDEDDTFTINANTTLYAQWTQTGGGSNTGSITITQNEVASFTNTYDWYTWTSNSISGQMYAYKNNGMQFNSSKTAYWVYNTTAIPGRITSITMTKASGTDRNWTLKVGNSALTTTTDGTQMGQAQTVGANGATWNVTGNYDYFLLYVSGGSTVISSIVINYETVTSPTISFNPSPIALGNVLVGQQIQKTFTVSQANLTAGITLSASVGTLSTNSIAQGDPATQVTWTYTPATAGAISATITATSGTLSETLSITGTAVTPMTVTDAINAIDNATGNNVSDAYVEGIISYVEYFSQSNHYITYYISDDGTRTDELQVYHGMGLNGAGFTAITDLNQGDQVVVHGDLTLYHNNNNNTDIYEFADGSELVSLTPHQAQQYGLTVSALTNVEMFVFDSDDQNNALIEGGATAQTVQVYDGTSILVSVSAANGYALATFTVDGVDHLADIEDDAYEFIMPAHIVNITATAVPVYTIMFSIDGQEWAAAQMEVSQGQAIGTLPTPAAASIPTGYVFVGWYTDNYTNATTAPNYVTSAFVPTSDITLKAVFAVASVSSSSNTYALVSDVANLNDGDVIIMVSTGSYTYSGTSYNFTVANGEVNSNTNLMDPVDVTISEDKVTSTDVAPITLVAVQGGWKLMMGNQYLKNVSGQNQIILDNEGAINTISISSGIASIGGIADGNDTRNIVYNPNNGNGRFAYYKTAQKPISIYKQELGVTYSDYCTSSTESYSEFTLTIVGYGADYDPDNNNNAGYYLIASPVSEAITPNQNNGFITGNYDLYYFDYAAGDGLEWRNFKDASFAIQPCKGYLYASYGDTELVFSGTEYGNTQAEDGEIELNAGWNLIGNPYNDITDLFYSATDDYVLEYYKMNEDGNELELVDDVYSANSEGIAPMEGVFVWSDNGNESVYFLGQGMIGQSINVGSLSINISKNRGNVIDRAIVRFNGGGMMPKLQLNPNHTKVYFTQGNKDYAIVCSTSNGEMAVNFKAETNGSYTIAVSPQNVELSYLHLIDNMTGADVDLLATPSYTFEAKTTDYASRFRLVFNANNSVNENDNFAFFNGSEWTISNIGEATLQVVDVMGRVLSSETVNGNTTISLNQVPGVYMLRLVNGDNVQVQKIVVR